MPVLSRLSWAWLAFGALSAAALTISYFDGGRTRAMVAMAIEGVERIAPPAPAPVQVHEQPERLAAADTMFASADAPTSEADVEDALSNIDSALPIATDAAADVYITVDGAPARPIGAEKKKQAAGFTPIAAPADDLLRRSAYGMTPRIAADGRKPSEVYAQKFKPGDNPNVALIVGGLGLNRALTERAIDELPANVTLAFAPYSKDLPFWTKRARDAGHEILVEIPMENRAADAEALGPAALLTSRTAEENAQRLDWILSRFGGYVGVTNYLGAKFVGDSAAMEDLLQRINASGLAYFDDTGALGRAGRKMNAATVNRVIDPGFGTDKVQSKRDLEGLEAIAKASGDALGKTYVHDETLGDIAAWAASLEDRGLTLAPASAVLALRASES